jgi:hypothetical protein
MGPVVLAALLAALAVEGARWGHRRLSGWNATRSIFARATAGTTRPFEARLSYPLADRYRPAGQGCSNEVRALLYHHQDLAQLERMGDRHGLASVYALACDQRRARQQLQEMPADPNVASDLAALAVDTPDAHGEALRRLDQVLRVKPRHPQALWNRGLILTALSLPLAAARSFRAVEAIGEPGWSREARQRAEALEKAAADLVAAEKAAERAVAPIGKAEVPAQDVIARYPEAARIKFYGAMRERSGAAVEALLPVAQAIDRVQGGSSLAQMVNGAVDLKRMFALTQPPLTVAGARAYQRLAAITGDPWQEIRGWQLLGRAEADAHDFDAALASFDRVLALCGQRNFPDMCTATKAFLAAEYAKRYQLQRARELAGAAKRDGLAQGLAWWDTEGTVLLQRIEDLRQEFGLAAAYAEEISLHVENCRAAQKALTYLAESAIQQGHLAEARAHLAQVRSCGAGGSKRPRFDLVGLSVLGALVRDPNNRGEELRWWNESLAEQKAKLDEKSPLERTNLLLIEGRALIERDPARAQSLLNEVIRTSEAIGSGDPAAVTKRLEAFSTLIVFAAARGDHQAAFDLLARALRVSPEPTCVVGAAAESDRRAYLARGPDGRWVGMHTVDSGRWETFNGIESPLPGPIQAAVAACPRVDVLATAPFFGRSRLLPESIAWGYLTHGELPAPSAGEAQRLVVHDVATPATLQLAPLSIHQPALAGPRENVIALTGLAATPDEVLRRLPGVDLVELHVHGLLDRNVSDAPALVLAPNRAGISLLSAREIEQLRLERHPGVILGACDVGQSARYWSYQHSLPAAFIQAGAGWVLASPAPVEDGDAGPFFDRVWRRTREGARLAVALRDERQAPRWSAAESDWVRHVIAFY